MFFDKWNGNNLGISEDATLYVPAGTAEKYKATDGWKLFKNIVEGVPESVVHQLQNDATKEVARYNLFGHRISPSHAGLNIIKMSDGTTRKMMIK